MKVYLAGPYSLGDVILNVRAAFEMADKVVARGHCPYVPHATAFWHLVTPRPYEFWLAYDNVWLLSCDVVLRIPGESNGADKEVALAREVGIPVISDVEDLPIEVSPFL